MTFQHWAGVSSYTSSYDFAETYVFGKQLLGPILCDLSCDRHLFSRSYEVILPSSLTKVIPPVLCFSHRPPVSVWGTGTQYISSSFSRQREFMYFVTIFTPHHHSRLIIWRTSLPNPAYDLATDFHPRGYTILLRPCLDSLSILSGTGISTCYPSPTAFALSLGPDLLWVVQPSPENLGHSTALIVSTLALLMPAFSLVYSPHALSIVLLPVYIAPLPIYKNIYS